MRKQQAWESSELEILRAKYPTVLDINDMLEFLPNRTKNQIRCKAHHIGLVRAATCAHLPPLELSPTSAAYLAGIVDGEGTISISTYRNKARKKQIQLLPRIWVFNSDTQLMNWLVETTGICTSRRRETYGLNDKPIYEWKVGKIADVVRMLKAIVPYLIVKKGQAELVLEFSANHILYAEYTEREFAILEEIRHLNRRGK